MPYKDKEKRREYHKEYYKKWYKKYKLKNNIKSKSESKMGSKNPNYKGGVEKDKEYIKKRYLKWKRKNREHVNFYNRHNYILLKNINGSHTLKQWKDLKELYNYTCPRCGKSEPEIKLTEDHIQPISLNGTDYIDNIQPLCGICNSIKHIKIIFFKPQRLTTC